MGSSILKQMTSLYNKLQYVYAQGGIPYPRVANNYIELDDIKFYEYPHLPFSSFDEYSIPLQEESYLLSKETFPLYLTHKNISTPATLLRNMAYIDIYFDDDMHPRKKNTYELNEMLDEIIGIFREDAQEIYTKETKEGSRKSRNPKYLLEDSDLLSVISKDGDVLKKFQMKIMPYTIVLEPYISQEKTNEEKEEKYFRSMNVPVSIEKPRAFKIFSSPLKNYSPEITNDPIQIESFNDFLAIETIRQRHENILIKKDEVSNIADVKKFNDIHSDNGHLH